VSKIVMN